MTSVAGRRIYMDRARNKAGIAGAIYIDGAYKEPCSFAFGIEFILKKKKSLHLTDTS